IYDSGLEIVEGAPSRRPRVGDSGHSHAQGVAIWLEAPRAARVAVLGEARVDVDVDIDEARSHIPTGGIDGFRGARRRDVCRHGSDLTLLEGDVPNCAEIVLAIDDVTALDQQVIIRLGAGHRRERQTQKKLRICHMVGLKDYVRTAIWRRSGFLTEVG